MTGFVPELRPAWWVLRGYLAVQALAVALTPLFNGGGFSFPVPQLLGSSLLGLLAVAAAVAGSVALGRRGARSWGVRGLLAAGNAALVVVALLLVAELGNSEAVDDHRPEFAATSAGPVSGLRSGGREISNIFPFGPDGEPLRDVYLIDQEGQPLVATHYDNELLEPRRLVDRNGDEVANRYPQEQRQLELDTGRRDPGPTRSSGPRRGRCARPDRRGYPAPAPVGVTTEKWPPEGSTRTAMRPEVASKGGAPTEPPRSAARRAASSVSRTAK